MINQDYRLILTPWRIFRVCSDIMLFLFGPAYIGIIFHSENLGFHSTGSVQCFNWWGSSTVKQSFTYSQSCTMAGLLSLCHWHCFCGWQTLCTDRQKWASKDMWKHNSIWGELNPQFHISLSHNLYHPILAKNQLEICTDSTDVHNISTIIFCLKKAMIFLLKKQPDPTRPPSPRMMNLKSSWGMWPRWRSDSSDAWWTLERQKAPKLLKKKCDVDLTVTVDSETKRFITTFLI